MKTVAVYYAGIPPRNTNLEKRQVLEFFAEGVRKCNLDDRVSEVEDMRYRPTDLAVIQGWVHDANQTASHLKFRKTVIDEQKKLGKNVLAIDSNLFLYKDPDNKNHYLRFSLNDIFPINGFYFDDDVDPQRWNKIKTDLNFDLKPWRTDGKHILICLQRNGGWSMKGLDVMTWLYDTINKIKKVSDRPIVVRGHPGDRQKDKYLKFKIDNVSISNKHILEDLVNAWATVVYNSSPAVVSAIEGIPVFVTDPNPKYSQAFSVANLNLENIENPQIFERQQWIEKISMSHWNFDDLKNGDAWKIIRKYV